MARYRDRLGKPWTVLAAEERSVIAPLLVVVAYGAVSLLTAAPVLVAVADRLPETMPIAVAVGGEEIVAPGTPVAIMAAGIPLQLLLWAIVAVVTYGGARLLGGEGGFARTVQFVGWGFLPKLLSAFALAVLAFGATLVLPETSFVDLLMGAREEIDLTSLSPDGPAGPLIPIVFVIEVLASLWMVYIWYGGLSDHHELSRWRALALVALLFLMFSGV